MFKHRYQLTKLVLPMALAALHISATASIAQKPNKKSVAFSPVTLSITSNSSVVSACPGEGNSSGSKVTLNANANSPNGHPLRYRWSTTAGHIVGDGATVLWDLSGLQPGYYKAFVNAYTGNDEEACEAFSSMTVVLNRCAPPPPLCPNVSITCPDNIMPDKPLTFSANVTGIPRDTAPVYNWTVSAGRIIEGQGTSSVKVDTAALAGQTITATLSLGGYNLDCSASCAVGITVPLVPSRKFDEFPDIARDDEKARLDNLAVELQSDPATTAYIIVYPNRRGRPGDLQRHTRRIVEYLTNSRGVDARRIVSLVGPPRDDLLIELWANPRGAKPPAPTP